MRSRNDERGGASEVKTVLLLTAIGLSALEFFIPRIPLFPWLKPGLAHCVTIFWIARFGLVDALVFLCARVWLVGFYFGFSLLTLALSLSGGVAAVCGMWLVWHVGVRRGIVGMVGVGVVGALLHNGGQLLAVYIMLARNPRLFLQLPLMLTASVVFGSIVGFFAWELFSHTDGLFERTRLGEHAARSPGRPTSGLETIGSIGVLAASVGLIMVENMYLLAAAACTATLAAAWANRNGWRSVVVPLRRFWLLLVAVSIFHLFFSYGTRVPGPLPITYEGVRSAATQCLRIWTWLQLSSVLTRLRFHILVLGFLTSRFPRYHATIYSAVLALEYFPLVAELVRTRFGHFFHDARRGPRRAARELVRNMLEEMEKLVVSTATHSVEVEKGESSG